MGASCRCGFPTIRDRRAGSAPSAGPCDWPRQYPDRVPTPTPTPTPTPPAPVPSLTPSAVPVDPTVVLNPSVSEVFDFVAALVSSLVWPAVVVIFVLMFRAPLRTVMHGIAQRVGHLRKFTGPGGFGFEFGDVVEQAGKLASELPVPSPEDLAADAPQAAEVALGIPAELAKFDPVAAVIAAYIPVEEAIEEYMGLRGVIGQGPMPFLMRDEALPNELRFLLMDLFSLRGRVHRRHLDIPYESAMTYIESAEKAAQQLRLINARLGFGLDIDPSAGE